MLSSASFDAVGSSRLVTAAASSSSSGFILDELGPPEELGALSRDPSAQRAIQRAVEEGSASLETGYVTPAMLDMTIIPGRNLVYALRELLSLAGT